MRRMFATIDLDKSGKISWWKWKHALEAKLISKMPASKPSRISLDDALLVAFAAVSSCLSHFPPKPTALLGIRPTSIEVSPNIDDISVVSRVSHISKMAAPKAVSKLKSLVVKLKTVNSSLTQKLENALIASQRYALPPGIPVSESFESRKIAVVLTENEELKSRLNAEVQRANAVQLELERTKLLFKLSDQSRKDGSESRRALERDIQVQSAKLKEDIRKMRLSKLLRSMRTKKVNTFVLQSIPTLRRLVRIRKERVLSAALSKLVVIRKKNKIERRRQSMAVIIQSVMRMQVRRSYLQRVLSSCGKIQRISRGFLGRLNFKLRKIQHAFDLEEKARQDRDSNIRSLTRIQTAFRCKIARIRVEKLRLERLERDLATEKLESSKRLLRGIEELAIDIVETILNAALKNEEEPVMNEAIVESKVPIPELTPEVVGRQVRYSVAQNSDTSSIYKVVKVNANRGLVTIKAVVVDSADKSSVLTLHYDDPGIVWSEDCTVTMIDDPTQSPSSSSTRPPSLVDAVGYGVCIRLSDKSGDEIHGLVVSVKVQEAMLVVAIDGDNTEEEIPYDTKELEWTARRFAPDEVPHRVASAAAKSVDDEHDEYIRSQAHDQPRSRGGSHDSESYADLSSDHDDA